MAFCAFVAHHFLKEVWERRGRTWPECLEMWIYLFFSSPVSLETLLSTQKCVSGVCLKSWSTVQSAKAACCFEMSAAVVFLPRFGFSLVMKTLIPRAGVWSMSLLPRPTLISFFCFFFPPTPFLLKFLIPLFHVTAGVILGLAMWECPAYGQKQNHGVLAKPQPRCWHLNLSTTRAADTGVCST